MEDPDRLKKLSSASHQDLTAYRGGNLIHNKKLLKFYHDTIMQNAHLFKDKVVMDLNCGTGILSLFLAKAGAKRVIAVDPYAHFAHDIVRDNNLNRVIAVVQMEARKINKLPISHSKVDMIVSDWAYFSPFFCEKKIRDLIHCRDKWLSRPFGILFPDEVQMFISAFEDTRNIPELFDFWDNVFGCTMQAIKDQAIIEPKKNVPIDTQRYITDKRKIYTFNLYTLKETELSFKTAVFKLNKKLDTKSNYINGLNVYHEVKFTSCHLPTILSASPRGQYGGLHYSFYTQDPIVLEHLTDLDGYIKVDPILNSVDNEVRVELSIGLNYTRTVNSANISHYYKISHGL